MGLQGVMEESRSMSQDFSLHHKPLNPAYDALRKKHITCEAFLKAYPLKLELRPAVNPRLSAPRASNPRTELQASWISGFRRKVSGWI